MTYEDDRKEILRLLYKQIQSGYLSKKKLINMQPDELIQNKKLIDEEIERRGIGMLFGV